VIIEPATVGDLPVIIAMRAEASEWLRALGVDQWRDPWPTYDAMVKRIGDSIEDGETWMIRDQAGGVVAATVALDAYGDPRLWTPAERQEPALYLHRLIVRRGWEGLGSKVLDWACARAASLGKDWVRIDVWTDNEPLHRYYHRHEFEHVRSLDLDDYPSGALFQRRVTVKSKGKPEPSLQSPNRSDVGPVADPG
jgi:GNAT superfamily N-acetyltransferase